MNRKDNATSPFSDLTLAELRATPYGEILVLQAEFLAMRNAVILKDVLGVTPTAHRRALELQPRGGFHLEKLLNLFPNAHWHTIDEDAASLDLARSLHAGNPRVTCEHTALADHQPQEPYDLIVGVAVAQRNPAGLPEYLARVRELLKPGGIFLAVESFSPTDFCHPNLPEFRALLDALYHRLRASGAHDAGYSLVCNLETSGFTDVRADLTHVHPWALPKDLYVKYLRAVARLAHMWEPDKFKAEQLARVLGTLERPEKTRELFFCVGGVTCAARRSA